MPSTRRSTSTIGSCSKACSRAASSSASDHTFEIPTDEPSRAGFTNSGGFRRAQVERPAVAGHRVLHLRHPVRGQQVLEERLVHRQRGCRHARSHVGHVEQLQQPLHRAVLAERAVQHRERDVRAEQPAAGLQRQRPALARPAAVALEQHLHGRVAGVGQAGADRLGGGERHSGARWSALRPARRPSRRWASPLARACRAPRRLRRGSPRCCPCPPARPRRATGPRRGRPGRGVDRRGALDRLEAGRPAARGAPPPRPEPTTSGTLDLLRAARHRDRDPGAGVDLRARRGILRDHLVLGLVGWLLAHDDLETLGAQAVLGRVAREPDHVGHLHLLRAASSRAASHGCP